MGTPSASRSPIPTRRLVGLLTLAFAIVAGAWLSADLAARDSKKEEEEETVKPKKNKPAGQGQQSGKPRDKSGRPKEEEEEVPGRRRKVIPVDDDEPAPSKARPRLKLPPEPAAQTSLLDALREAKYPEEAALYTRLKLPHDALTVRASDEIRIYAIEPQSRYFPPGEEPRLNIEARTYDSDWHLSNNWKKYGSALRLQPYEEVVTDAANEFLKQDPARLKVPRTEMLRAAETVLVKADRFHASRREGGVRRGDEWRPVGQRLRERLVEVQRERLAAFVAVGDWDGALAYARTLADTYRNADERAPIAAVLVRTIQDGLPANARDDQWRLARDRFRQLKEIFAGSPDLQSLAGGLRGHAQSLLNEARRLKAMGKHEAASVLIQQAADLDSSLPELADELASLAQDHPILHVGVSELPINMTPGRAVTDADLRAVELMYEGLVKPRVEAPMGQRYVPALAGTAPVMVPLGREFRIARDAAWSDGTPITVGDVKETLRAMRKENWVGHSPLWGKMVEDAEGGGDSSRLSLRLSQGYIDPLSLMCFKVMPQSLLRQPSRPGSVPVGSGPYQYKETTTLLNRKAARFLANPAYADRAGKAGLPRYREIHFVQFAEPDEAVAALRAGTLDLVLDLPAPKASALRGADALTVPAPMTSRRVYFLAINHRAAALQGNLFLRLALAQAIDRQAFLDKYFREAPGSKTHHSLNGPFPAGSWPCDKTVPAELYNPDGARGQTRKAVEKAGGPIRLKLKYAAADRKTREALQELCTAINRELRIDDKTFIELKGEPVEPYKLRQDVEQSHEYELAYYHYDHPSDAYWVAPLFDMQATDINGSNYLGYIDGELQTEFERAKNHRDFHDVQQSMRLVHRMLEQKMPLVPLWQLDTCLAHRRELRLDQVSVDPLLIFDDVENWPLLKK